MVPQLDLQFGDDSPLWSDSQRHRVGWPAGAAIALGTTIDAVIIPLALIVNLLLVLVNFANRQRRHLELLALRIRRLLVANVTNNTAWLRCSNHRRGHLAVLADTQPQRTSRRHSACQAFLSPGLLALLTHQLLPV